MTEVNFLYEIRLHIGELESKNESNYCIISGICRGLKICQYARVHQYIPKIGNYRLNIDIQEPDIVKWTTSLRYWKENCLERVHQRWDYIQYLIRLSIVIYNNSRFTRQKTSAALSTMKRKSFLISSSKYNLIIYVYVTDFSLLC